MEADFIHIGAYKGADEPLTREQFSPEVRENMTSIVDDLYDQLVTTIAADRLMTVERVTELVDAGMITATRAREAGLIDRVAYPDEFGKHLSEEYEADSLVYVDNYGKKKVDTDFSGPMGFVKLLQLMTGAKTGGSGANKKIAVVYAVGPIMSGESQSDPFGGQVMGATTIVEALRQADRDDKVAAIVLRIDSPGGSALASDLIWRETRRIEKPIVASMSDVAGSGGYYIAMGADKIVAAPGTITGSIGVVGGKLVVSGLLEKIGISTETIHRGNNSGIFSTSSRFSESEREALKSMMDDIYEQFTKKAAEGRGMPLDKLRDLAGGRIYTGRQAKRNGLIDEIGTLEDAVATAKSLAGMSKDEKVRLELLPEPRSFFEEVFGDLDAEKEVRAPLQRDLLPAELLLPEVRKAARQAYLLRQVFQQPVATWMPLDIEIH
jgi:protease-4